MDANPEMVLTTRSKKKVSDFPLPLRIIGDRLGKYWCVRHPTTSSIVEQGMLHLEPLDRQRLRITIDRSAASGTNLELWSSNEIAIHPDFPRLPCLLLAGF
jgi:hypothetical protein